MDDEARGFVEGVNWCFRDLKDPRVLGRCDHTLMDILMIAILAVTCGADDWTDIEVFANARAPWLRGFLELRNGIPSHDTFRRVFGLLNPNQGIATQIRQQKGHYVLALKGNQSSLADNMQTLFEEGMKTGFAGMEHEVQETQEKGHGRTEERAVHVIAVPADHPQRRVWTDLNTLAVVVTRRVVKDQEHWESRLYVSSHRPQAKMLAEAIRRHWSIENSQHWVLDVSFGEDVRRQQDRRGATNLAAVRRLVVSLLRQDKKTKRGAKAKRMKAALDPNYLLSIFKKAVFGA